MPAEVLEKERSIYRAQMENSGKPANVIDKIVEGKLGSFYKQVVLPDQESIRDPKMTVKDVLAAANKALGSSLTITRFARLKVGKRVTTACEVRGAARTCTVPAADRYSTLCDNPSRRAPPTNASC